MEELKEENQNLSLLAGQAEHLASVLNVSLYLFVVSNTGGLLGLSGSIKPGWSWWHEGVVAEVAMVGAFFVLKIWVEKLTALFILKDVFCGPSFIIKEE